MHTNQIFELKEDVKELNENFTLFPRQKIFLWQIKHG